MFKNKKKKTQKNTKSKKQKNKKTKKQKIKKKKKTNKKKQIKKKCNRGSLDESKAKPYLPANKQYLITKNGKDLFINFCNYLLEIFYNSLLYHFPSSLLQESERNGVQSRTRWR